MPIEKPMPKMSSLQTLNFDCSRMIFDYLSVPDLISLGRTNKYFFKLVENELIFENRLSKKMVIFASVPGLPKDMIETEDSFIISNPLIAAEMLETLGTRMRNIKIVKIYSGTHNTPNYSNLFTEHCKRTLEQLHLDNVRPTIGNNVIEPFQRVTNLSLDGFVLDLSSDRLDFSEMFPSLQSLYLGDSSLFYLQNLNSLITNFPHLKHLHAEIHDVELLEFYHPIDENVISEIICKNPQIKSLSLGVSSPRDALARLLKLVVKKLPDLEKLELNNFFMINDEIEFKNVKSLKSGNHIHSFHIPETIKFSDKLEELDAVMNEAKNKCFEFIENYKSLKIIRISAKNGFTNSDVIWLTHIKLNAVFLSMNVGNDMKHDTIIQFIEENKQLKELHLKLEIKNETKSLFKCLTQFRKKTLFDVAVLRKKIRNNWNLYENGLDIVIVKK